MPSLSILSTAYPHGFIIYSYFNTYFMTITLQLQSALFSFPLCTIIFWSIWKYSNHSTSHDIFDEWYKVGRNWRTSFRWIGRRFVCVCECFNKIFLTSFPISSQFSLSNDVNIKALLDVAILREFLHCEIGMAWSNAFIFLSNLINWKGIKEMVLGTLKEHLFCCFYSLSFYSLNTALVGMRLPQGPVFEEPGKWYSPSWAEPEAGAGECAPHAPVRRTGHPLHWNCIC